MAQQLSYKILTAPLSMFGSSVISESVLSKTGNLAAAEKAAHDFKGGIYTGGMAMSSAADKYVQSRAEGQGKLESSIRAMGTGLISYFSESLGGIGGSKSPLNGLEEKYAESLIGSILYNAFEEGGEEFVEYLGDYLLDGAVDLAARGKWQQEWSWEEVIENAKIGAMTGGLFGGYNKLQNVLYRRIDEANAIRLEKVAQEYSDYMKNVYRLMSDPNLREIAERQIGDTTIPTATRMASRETGEMNFGDVLPKKAGTVSAEQMYGVKLSQENKNESFDQWAEREDAKKKKAAEEAANAVEQSYEDFKKNPPAAGEKKPIKVSPYTTIKSPYEGESPNKKANAKGERVEIPAESFEEGKNIYEIHLSGEGQAGNTSKIKKALLDIIDSLGGAHNVVAANAEFRGKPYEVAINKNVAKKLASDIGKSAEKFAVLRNIDSIVENAEFVGSGDFEQHTTKNKNVTRYDYFETKVTINGKPYVVAFDVEVIPGTNRYRTHRVLNEISLTQTLGAEADLVSAAANAEPSLQRTNSAPSVEVGTVSTAQGTELSSQGDVPSPDANIPQNGSGVNTSDVKNSAAGTQQNSENAAKAQQAETEEEARLRTLYESEPESRQKKSGTVSAEQMYGVKLPQESRNESFDQWAAREDAKKKKAAEKEATLAEKQKNADSRSIRTDMTDDERYEALKNEKIKIEPYNSEKLKGENVEQLNAATSKEARKYIKTLAEKFEVFKKYISEKTKIEFRFARNNLAESASKQGKIKTEYAEMLSATDEIIQNAVLVEAHKDKYAGTTREDKTLLQTDVLLSAFADENGIVPVRLTVKEYKDKDNSLYALITLEKIETEVSGRGESFATTPEPYSVSEMSIPDIVSKIKPTDGKILKYLPDKLLNAEQLEGKRAALAKDKERIEGFSQKGDSAAGTQQNSENAAKAQQAETEEEARLRTLYESEPEGGQTEAEAGESGETDKTDKFIEDTQKRIEDAKITDDKLKNLPEDKRKEVLKGRAERAGPDMDADELVDFAQSVGRIRGLYGREFKDFARIFDDAAGESTSMRNELHKFFEVPHKQAQAQYTEGYKNAIKSMSKKFAELGIKEGSKESAAVQRIGEHAYQIDSKGNTAPYTEEMLKRDFPRKNYPRCT